MKQVQTPKDLNHVKTRMALGLTKRQLICFAAAGCMGFPLYLALHKALPTDVSALVMMVIIFPFFFFAMYEKDGKPPEKLLYDIYCQRFRSKGIRRYRSENIYERLEEQEKIRKDIASLEAKKNKDYELADSIRNELLDKGIELVDTREGTTYNLINK